jgi:hypothetical protein
MLKNGDHKLEIKWVNQNPHFRITEKSYVVYSDAPLKKLDPNQEEVVK